MSLCACHSTVDTDVSPGHLSLLVHSAWLQSASKKGTVCLWQPPGFLLTLYFPSFRMSASPKKVLESRDHHTAGNSKAGHMGKQVAEHWSGTLSGDNRPGRSKVHLGVLRYRNSRGSHTLSPTGILAAGPLPLSGSPLQGECGLG